MNTETTSHDNEMEFDINNQLGDSQMLAHISMGNQESGTRGPNDENTERQQITQETLVEIRERTGDKILPETNKDTDIYTILQQLLRQSKEIKEQAKETKEQVKETKEQVK